MTLVSALLDAGADLLLGSACVGCGEPGRVLCRDCRSGLPTSAVESWPTPTPVGLARPFATGAYDGALRAMVVGHKERRLLGLTRPLGELLATSVLAAARPLRLRLLLVPVPSRPSAVRDRGHDPTSRADPASRPDPPDCGPRAPRCPPAPHPRRPGRPGRARCRPALAPTSPARWPALLRAVRRHPARSAHVLVCDDVITTGATASRGAAGARGGRASPSSPSPPSQPPSGGTAHRPEPGIVAQPFRRSRSPTNVSTWSPPGSVVASSGRRGSLRASLRQADASRRQNGPRKATLSTDHGAA